MIIIIQGLFRAYPETEPHKWLCHLQCVIHLQCAMKTFLGMGECTEVKRIYFLKQHALYAGDGQPRRTILLKQGNYKCQWNADSEQHVCATNKFRWGEHRYVVKHERGDKIAWCRAHVVSNLLTSCAYQFVQHPVQCHCLKHHNHR